MKEILGSNKTRERLTQALGDRIDVEQFIVSVFRAAQIDPKIYECTEGSFYGAILTCAQLRLLPNTPLGHAYLLPRWNKDLGASELNFQIGFKGFIELVYRSRRMTVTAFEVYESDRFEYQLGTDPKIIHVPDIKGERTKEKLIAAYAIGKIEDMPPFFAVMSRSDIEKVRRVAKTDYVWSAWYEEMSKKSVIKRLLKLMPLTEELALAREVDDKGEIGEAKYLDEMPRPVLEPGTATNRYIADVKQLTEMIRTDDLEAAQDLKKRIRAMTSQPVIDQKELAPVIAAFETKFGIKIKEEDGKNV
jgi:recombination protein RecT